MTAGRARTIAFATVVLVCLVGVGAYLVSIAGRGTSATFSAPQPQSPSASNPPTATESYIAGRITSPDQAYGTVGTVPLEDPEAKPTQVELACERIHMSPMAGICLAVDRAVVTTARVLLLNSDLTVRHALTTPGIPSRARVSPDGRWAATTTFVYGHSYAAANFSTQTEIYDMGTGSSLGNLESWIVTHDGERVTAVDLNIWGVTFASDGNSFYATGMTGGHKYLGQGNIAERSIVLTDLSAECPSLSPSGRLLAYKSATSPATWQIRVRTIATGEEVVIDEERSVDDQIEWLDDDHVLYGLDRSSGTATDIWIAPADGSQPSSRFIAEAWSPTVVRAA